MWWGVGASEGSGSQLRSFRRLGGSDVRDFPISRSARLRSPLSLILRASTSAWRALTSASLASPSVSAPVSAASPGTSCLRSSAFCANGLLSHRERVVGDYELLWFAAPPPVGFARTSTATRRSPPCIASRAVLPSSSFKGSLLLGCPGPPPGVQPSSQPFKNRHPGHPPPALPQLWIAR